MKKLFIYDEKTFSGFLNFLKNNFFNYTGLKEIFPNRCYFCGDVIQKGVGICDDCLEGMVPIGEEYCLKCGAPVNIEGISVYICNNCGRFDFSFESNRSLFVYEKYIKELIHQFKFSKRWMLSRLFSRLFIKYMGKLIINYNYLIPVPLNKLRYRDRGFNQSLLIAERIGKVLEINIGKNILIRKGYSDPQSSTSGFFDRYNNMKDMIYVSKKFRAKIKGMKVLLLDDVLTTGITASRCAEALYDSGALTVSLITIARTLR